MSGDNASEVEKILQAVLFMHVEAQGDSAERALLDIVLPLFADACEV